ncbi:MAG: hypothetical protein NXH88_16800, partial [Hyphomonas sp.]|nr:hypothetical protein [Hyphomonas sp.]
MPRKPLATNPARQKAGFSGRGRTALLFALPQLAILFIFFYWPAGEALWWSVSLQSPFGGEARFVGLQVFEQVLSDPEYHRSLRITFTFVFFTTAIALALGLLFATAA